MPYLAFSEKEFSEVNVSILLYYYYFFSLICKVECCLCLYVDAVRTEVLLLVLLMFGQLRPCFPQGERSLPPVPASTVSLAHFSPLSICGSCSWSCSCVCTINLEPLPIRQQWKFNSTYILSKSGKTF